MSAEPTPVTGKSLIGLARACTVGGLLIAVGRTATSQDKGGAVPEVIDPSTWTEITSLVHAFDLERAIPLMEELHARVGLNSRTQTLVATYLRTGRYCEALDLLDRIEEGADGPASAWSSYMRASVLYEAGDHDAGTEQYRRCLTDWGDILPAQMGLAEIVRALDRAERGDTPYLRLRVDPYSSEGNMTCLPDSVAAILRYWGEPIDQEVLYRDVGSAKSLENLFEYAEQIPVLEVVPFIASVDNLRALLRHGYPVLLEFEASLEGQSRGHAAVVSGHDDSRNLFYVEDPNWERGWMYKPYAHVAGCLAFLVSPKDVVGAALAFLSGTEEAAHVIEADRMLVADRFDEAEFVCLQLLASGRSSTSWPFHGLSGCAQARGDWSRASEAAEVAVRLMPHRTFPEAWVRVGDGRTASRDWAGARGAYGQALELYPYSCSALVGICGVTAESGDVEGALAHCDKAISIQESNTEAHRLRSLILKALGRSEEAAVAGERYLELRASQPAVLEAEDGATVR